MHVRNLSLIFLAVLLIGCGSSKKVDTRPKLNLAIMNFESRSGMKQGEAETVADAFGSLLQQSGRFNVIDRKQIQQVIQEQGFQGAQEGSGAAMKAAQILAVKKMIFGSIGKLGDNYIMTVRMVDVGTSAVDLSISKPYDDDLEDIMKKFLPQFVTQVVQTIDGPQ